MIELFVRLLYSSKIKFKPRQLYLQPQRMTVNHDVVGSSPTGGVCKRSKERFFIYVTIKSVSLREVRDK